MGSFFIRYICISIANIRLFLWGKAISRLRRRTLAVRQFRHTSSKVIDLYIQLHVISDIHDINEIFHSYTHLMQVPGRFSDLPVCALFMKGHPSIFS